MWLVFGDKLPISSTVANINTVFPCRAGRAADPAYQGQPVFSEGKMKEARDDSLHFHSAARHFDVFVCLS